MENADQELYEFYSETYSSVRAGWPNRFRGEKFDKELGYYRKYNVEESTIAAIATDDAKREVQPRSISDVLGEMKKKLGK